MNNLTNTDLTILFLSCDKYQDLWEPLFHCIDTFWKDCPYPKYLGSNTKKFNGTRIKTILSGPDADWSTSLRELLKKIRTPYVFIWLDDSFPIEQVNSRIFSDTVDFMKKQNAKCVHAVPSPKPDTILDGGIFGEYKKGAPYRVTSQGFWNVSYLSGLLLPGESPWNFEILGSYRSMYSDGFYTTMKPFCTYLNAIEKGKIFRDVYTYCNQHGIPLKAGSREIIANGNYIKSELQKVIFNSMIRIPWKYRVSTMNMLRKILVSY